GPPRRSDDGPALLLGDIRVQEPDRMDLERDPGTRAGCEGLGETLLDQVPPLVTVAFGLDDLRVVGEKGCQSLAIALVVLADERLVDRADRFLVLGSILAAGAAGIASGHSRLRRLWFPWGRGLPGADL